MPVIQYQPTSGSPYPSGSYAIVPVGTWHELRRDLDADLRSVFGVRVEHVLWFCIRGSYDLDELTLIGREERSYCYAGGQRVAMRRGGQHKVVGDSFVPYTTSTVITGAGQRLGSTSLTTDENGAVVAEQRYYPYGQVRWSDGTLPTDHQFTGQKREASLGLYDYHARFYDPYIHCFISADTIVPNPGNPQDLNRYSYVRNSPLNYRDPSGHAAAVDQEGTVTVRSLGYAGMFMLLEHPAVTASAVDCIRQDIAVELGHALSSPKLGRDPAMSVATMSSRASSASAAG